MEKIERRLKNVGTNPTEGCCFIPETLKPFMVRPKRRRDWGEERTCGREERRASDVRRTVSNPSLNRPAALHCCQRSLYTTLLTIATLPFEPEPLFQLLSMWLAHTVYKSKSINYQNQYWLDSEKCLDYNRWPHVKTVFKSW